MRKNQQMNELSRRTTGLQPMEDRILFAYSAYQGIELQFPKIPMQNLDTGAITYNEATDTFALSSSASYLAESEAGPFNFFIPEADFQMVLEIDDAGVIQSGEFSLQGSVDTNGDFVADLSGELLSGQVLSYGVIDGDSGAGISDNWDFLMDIEGGLLESYFDQDFFGATVVSEISSFNGSFAESFDANVKGFLGGVDGSSVLLPARLGDYVWYDLDRDGVQDADEEGVEGVAVDLYAVEDDGLGGTTNVYVGTATTDENGYYIFEDLPAGTYTVQFDESTFPAGWEYTTINQGGDDATDSDADAASDGFTHTTTLEAGEEDLTLDMGLVPLLGELGDLVWYDCDNDGIQDEGESGVEGVTVTLSGTDIFGNTVTATTVTDAEGNYLFGDLVAGDYQVTFVVDSLPDGYGLVEQDQGTDDALDSDANAETGITEIITLAAGESNLTIDAGITRVKTGCKPKPTCKPKRYCKPQKDHDCGEKKKHYNYSKSCYKKSSKPNCDYDYSKKYAKSYSNDCGGKSYQHSKSHGGKSWGYASWTHC